MSEECYVNPKEIIEVIRQYSILLEQEGRDGSWPAWIESAILHGTSHRRETRASWYNLPVRASNDGGYLPSEWACGNCDKTSENPTPFCPHCGARMNVKIFNLLGEEEENDGNI